MFGAFFQQFEHRFHQSVARGRRLVGLWALAIVVYFVAEYTIGVPYHTLIIQWQPDGRAVVTQADSGALSGDLLLAIDGLPVVNSDTQFRFAPMANEHIYTLQRGPNIFALRLPSSQPTFKEFIALILPGLVALEAGVLGFMILFFAPVDDYAAWLTGLVTLGFAVALAASSAAASGIPGAHLAYGGLVPIISVGYLEMAFLPGASNARSTGQSPGFRVLYGVATLISALAMVEIFGLNPNSSWEALIGIRISHILLVSLGLALTTAPVLMALRLGRLTSTYARRQIIILLAATGLATLPLITMTLVPELLGVTWLPWEITLPLLGLIPAAYGYVIYRHRYLNLDLFVSRSAIVLMVALIISALYTLGVGLIGALPNLAPLGPLAGAGVLLACFSVMGKINARLHSAINWLLYGRSRHFDEASRELTARLSADPEIQTLKTILLGRVPELLQVRQAMLLLPDQDGQLVPVGMVRVETTTPFQPDDLDQSQHIHFRETSPELPVFDRCAWAHMFVPLHVQNRVVGALLLGAKAPDGNFDAQEVAFVQHIALAAASAAESARLFEALRDMSQDLMRVRAAERMQLASRLHNEPLQRAAAVAYGLDRVLTTLPNNSEAAIAIVRQKDEVQRLTHEIRDICAGLRPRILDEGLTLTLHDAIHSFRANNPEVHVDLDFSLVEEPTLANEALDTIYHVLTEALTNVVKHALATRVNIVCQRTADGLTLSITDDGRGTPLARMSLPELVRDHHFGVVGMHQSAKIAHGQLEMKPAPLRGTTVTLTLPLTNGAKAN